LTDMVENNHMLPPDEFKRAARLLAGNIEALNRHVDQYSK
jgi:hypothetical protein